MERKRYTTLIPKEFFEDFNKKEGLSKYWELIAFIEDQTELIALNDEEITNLNLDIPEGGYFESYFFDKNNEVWEGELNGVSNPDGSIDYHLKPLDLKNKTILESNIKP